MLPRYEQQSPSETPRSRASDQRFHLGPTRRENQRVQTKLPTIHPSTHPLAFFFVQSQNSVTSFCANLPSSLVTGDLFFFLALSVSNAVFGFGLQHIEHNKRHSTLLHPSNIYLASGFSAGHSALLSSTDTRIRPRTIALRDGRCGFAPVTCSLAKGQNLDFSIAASVVPRFLPTPPFHPFESSLSIHDCLAGLQTAWWLLISRQCRRRASILS
jgi:hypothetical protein